MKKLFFALLSLLLISGATLAQDGKKELKKATRAIAAFNLDASAKAKLVEAKDAVDLASNSDEVNATSKFWSLKAQIYNEIATQFSAARQLNLPTEDLPKVDYPAIDATDASIKALELAEKKYEKKDALKYLTAAQSNLYNMGIFAYEDKDFDKSFLNFKKLLEAHDALKENGEASTLDVKEEHSNQVYLTGHTALSAGKVEEATTYFKELYAEKYEKAGVYESLYKINSVEDEEGAYKYLEEGRKLFPDDVGLLFTEINYFLKMNKMDVLLDKLKMAIEKEPDNVSLYSTMGSVYDNLYQKEMEAGNKEAAQKNFDSALTYFEQALEKEPKYFDALYSLGALYYNKAALLTKQRNEIPLDQVKLYNEMGTQIDELFATALPYFTKAESLNPNDGNTLIALKEIFAKKNDFETSNEFKARFENVQNGGTNESSFFNE